MLTWLEHRHRGDANGQNSLHWPATGSTGDAATPTGRPVRTDLLPLPLPCREDFCTPTAYDSRIYLAESLASSYIAEFRVWGLGAANKRPTGSGDSVCESAFGGEDAGTFSSLPKLAPAAPPLACPLAPTGGDALILQTSISGP